MNSLKSILILAIVAGAFMLFAGCVAEPVPPTGIIFTKVGFDGKHVEPQEGWSKTGSACAQGVLGYFAWGDATQAKAMENGGIKKISAVDHEVTSVSASSTSYVYKKYCTIVSGE